MARRFEFVEGSSSKFWEVSVDGNTMTVVFGKIGTPGQTKPKAFASAEAAQKEADKLVSEKTKKGYVEVAGGAAPAPAAPPAAKKKPPSHPEYAVFLKAGEGFFSEPEYGEVTFGDITEADHYLDSADGEAWGELFKSIKWLGQEADGGIIGAYEGAIVYLSNEGSLTVTGKTLVDHFASVKNDEELDALIEFASEHGLPAPLSRKERAASVKAVPSPEKKLEALRKKFAAPAGGGVRPVDRHPTLVALPDGRAVVVSSEDDVNERENYDAHAAFLFSKGQFSKLPETPFKSYLALHGAGALPDGRAVFIGAGDTLRAMIFDLATQKWEAGPALEAKQEHPGVQLLTDGRVLVAGGERGYPHKTDAIQLYDVKKKKWSAGGKLKVARERPAMALLPDGRVLVLAGAVKPEGDDLHSDVCEVFDPKTNTVKAIAKPKGAFDSPHALLLADGRVLLADQGGICSVYDPKKDAWTKPLEDDRISVPMVQLSDGRVAFFHWNQTVTLLDPKTLKLSDGGKTLVGHGTRSAAMALPGGQALVVGGDLYNNIASEPEIYDSASRSGLPIAGFEKQMKKQQAALAKKRAKS